MRAADILCGVLAVLALSSAGACAQQQQQQQQQDEATTGRRLALQLCSGCHFVAPGQRLPMAVDAPTFQEIARRPETTEFALRNIIRTPHPIMPTLILTQEEADGVVSYILSLKRSAL